MSLRIRHSLKIWETGKKASGKRFAANQYVVYDQYLKALQQYDKGKMTEYWRHIRCTAHKKGLYVNFTYVCPSNPNLFSHATANLQAFRMKTSPWIL